MEENSTNLSPETLSVCWGKGTVRYSEWKINMASPQCSNISALAATVGWVAEAQMESVCLSVWNWLNDRLGVGQADWLGHGIASFGYLQINQEVVIKSQFFWNHDSYQLNFNIFYYLQLWTFGCILQQKSTQLNETSLSRCIEKYNINWNVMSVEQKREF